MDEPSRHEIWKMFDDIAPTYDRVNRAMTFGLDPLWRKRVAAYLPQKGKIKLLDCATGTADQIIAIMEKTPHVEEAIGIDLASEMLSLGRKKLQSKPYHHHVHLIEASATALPFSDGSFDCVTISFGIRNIPDVPLCLREIFRVLKSGGRMVILEGSIPTHSALKKLHLFYLRHLMPRIGGWLSKHPEAYRYLNQTIETFPQGKALCSLIKEAGFATPKSHPQCFGAVTIYTGDKS